MDGDWLGDCSGLGAEARCAGCDSVKCRSKLTPNGWRGLPRHRLISLNCDRIWQRRPAFGRHTTQKVPVLVEHQAVVGVRHLALLPRWVFPTNVVPALSRAPESLDNALCAGRSDC